jgi:hypothetical protein
MPKPTTTIDYILFWIKRDAAMMREALDELDPFVEHAPCYANRLPEETVNEAA